MEILDRLQKDPLLAKRVKLLKSIPGVGEVTARGGMADAGLAGEVAQREGLEAVLAEGAFGLVQQRGAQAAVVIRAVSHAWRGYQRMLSLTA